MKKERGEHDSKMEVTLKLFLSTDRIIEIEIKIIIQTNKQKTQQEYVL